MIDEQPVELVVMNKYRLWKLLQPRPPLIDPRDRLTIVPDEPGKDDDDKEG